MFRIMRNSWKNGTFIQQAFANIRRRFSPDWSAEEHTGPRALVLRLSGPDKRRIDRPLIARKGLFPRDVAPAKLLLTSCSGFGKILYLDTRLNPR